MKRDSNQFEVDSSSTQEREKRFSRKSQLKTSRSKSSRSDASSLSKFYIKNLDQRQKTQDIRQIITRTVNKDEWTPPKRQSTPYKTMREKQIKLPKDELLNQQCKDLLNLKEELKKYEGFAKKQSKENEEIKKENLKLKERVRQLEKQLDNERKNLFNVKLGFEQLKHKLAHKDKMIDYWQKEQNPLKKIKNSIFQSRVAEFEKEKEELSTKIRELEETIEDLKNESSISILKCSGMKSSANFDMSYDLILPTSFSEERHIHKIECQLFDARQQIKKLHIQLDCERKKMYHEMETYKQKTEKDYLDLKNKFSDFLKKYKVTMKKFATFQVKNLVDAHREKGQTRRREKSLESLTLSEDQQDNLMIQ